VPDKALKNLDDQHVDVAEIFVVRVSTPEVAEARKVPDMCEIARAQ
jgi:hypothetical protein